MQIARSGADDLSSASASVVGAAADHFAQLREALGTARRPDRWARHRKPQAVVGALALVAVAIWAWALAVTPDPAADPDPASSPHALIGLLLVVVAWGSALRHGHVEPHPKRGRPSPDHLRRRLSQAVLWHRVAVISVVGVRPLGWWK